MAGIIEQYCWPSVLGDSNFRLPKFGLCYYYFSKNSWYNNQKIVIKIYPYSLMIQSTFHISIKTKAIYSFDSFLLNWFIFTFYLFIRLFFDQFIYLPVDLYYLIQIVDRAKLSFFSTLRLYTKSMVPTKYQLLLLPVYY